MSLLEQIIAHELSRGRLRLAEFAHKAATRPGYTTWLCNQMHYRQRGFTYFVRMEAPVERPPVKIGFSMRPDDRLANFGPGSPYPLTLVATFPACLLPEKVLHARFVHLRLRGEWFSPDEELSALIESVKPVSRHESWTFGGTDKRASAGLVDDDETLAAG